MTNVTRILSQIENGDSNAAEQLLPLVYNELRNLAAAKLANEKPGQTLQATALVHEAYLRLVQCQAAQDWRSRRHFFGAAAEAMRRILVDRARRKNRHRHGVNWERVHIQLDDVADSSEDSMLESLDEALTRFEKTDATACELVKLRYFAGLTLKEAATALDLAPRTADRLWAYAKAWLLTELREGSDTLS